MYTSIKRYIDSDDSKLMIYTWHSHSISRFLSHCMSSILMHCLSVPYITKICINLAHVYQICNNAMFISVRSVAAWWQGAQASKEEELQDILFQTELAIYSDH